MCLTCLQYKGYKCIVIGKEDIKGALEFNPTKNYLHTYKNELVTINDTQRQEIIDNALALVCTGVDLSCDIWAIQWPNDYKPINF